MGSSSPCPHPEQLQAFTQRTLAEAAAQALEQHIEQCPDCAAALQRLCENDQETNRIRHPPSDQGLALFKDSAQVMGQPHSSPAAAEEHGSSEAGSPSFGAAPSYPFLSPPVAPGEIGRLGNYRVLRLLGRGGMGMVFHAEDIALRRSVALKIVKPDLDASYEPWRRFLREARTIAAIKHENVVTIFQSGQEGNVVYLAMEFLEGQSLETWMKRGPEPAVSEIVRLGREMASGLAAIHRHGLVHRDIKPANIWLEAPQRRVKILDFGIWSPGGGRKGQSTASTGFKSLR